MGKSTLRRFALFVLTAVALAGCSGKNPPDTDMTTSPTGLWIGKADSGTSIDIQAGGQLKITRAGREVPGTWTVTRPGEMRISMEGKDYDVPFQRRDLSLRLTLPGDPQESVFEQM